MTVLLICPVGPLERVIMSGTSIIAQISMSLNDMNNVNWLWLGSDVLAPKTVDIHF